MSSEVNGNENYVEVDGNKVWYEKIGDGPNVVLLIPGPIGTGRTDFAELIDSEDELDFDKFTVIAVDPVGNGRSRPPHRIYSTKVYENDCNIYLKLMQSLGYTKYSVIGWSEGAKVALLMAIKSDCIQSLVLVSISNFYTNKNLSALASKKSVDTLNKDRLKAYIKCYGSKEEVQKQWNRYTKFVEFYNQYFPTDIFQEKYHCVRCPVLIVHGDKDQTIELDQPLVMSKKLIAGKIHRFPNGENECHIKYAAIFKDLVEDHIISSEGFTGAKRLTGEDSREALENILYKTFN